MTSILRLFLITCAALFIQITNSNAQFLQPKRIFSNYRVTDVKSFDVDNDGLNDLIIFSPYNQMVLYRKNLGGGLYKAPTVIFDGLLNLDEWFEESLVISDKDNDGDIDILLISWTKLIILENHNGYFEPQLIDIGTYFYGDDPYITLHDADADGDDDIFIHDAQISSASTQIKVYENISGNFVFANSISLLGFVPNKINFYDYNLDGNKDLLIYKSSTNQLRVYNYQSPFAYSGTLVTISGVNNIEKLVVADFENDGDDDILQVGTCLSYYKTNGPSNLSGQINTECNNWRSNYADFDNDGRIDAVSFDDDNDSLQFYKNNGSALQLVQSYFLEPMNLTKTHLADINGDGLMDVITSDDYHAVRIYINQGNFSFILESIVHAPAASSLAMYGNLDGTGNSDFLTTSPRKKLDGTIYTAFRSFTQFPDFPDSFEEFVPDDSLTYYHLVVGNVDNDGLDDIIALEGISKDFVWFKNLGGSFAPSTFIYDNNFIMASSISQIFQDLDNDGDLDIISYNNFSTDFVFLINDGSGNFAPEVWDLPFSYSANVIFKTCNLNNDGFPDFIFWDDAPDEARVFQSTSLNTFNQILFIDSTTLFIPMLAVDINADSHDEIIIQGIAVDHYILAVDSVSYSLQPIADVSSNSTKWIAMDYDFDNFPELLAPQHLSESVFLYPNASGSVGSNQAISFGAGQSDARLVDYDSDSDQDLYTRNVYTDYFISENIGDSRFSIQGNYFLDITGNGIFDGADVPINFGGINMVGTNNQYMLYPFGNYKFFVDSGDYDLTSILDNNPVWIHTTDSAYSVSLTSSNTSANGLDFGVIPNGAFIRNDATAASFSCIGPNNIWLSHLYMGTNYENLLFELELHPSMGLNTAYFPIDSISANSIYWSDSIINYNSSLVNLLSFQFNSSVIEGSELDIYYRIYGIDSFGGLTELNTDTLTGKVTCSYDPNDKVGFPFGVSDEHYILANQDLTYTIRFQNTGSDTAHNVMIADYFSDDLDWSQFEFISSSYPCATTIDSDGLLLAKFNGIMLPDSNINEPSSHGFLKFKIKQQADLPTSTVITNQAEIYFDFNEAVITNTTFHTIYSCNDLSENLVFPNSEYCLYEPITSSLDPVLLDSLQWNLNGVYLSTLNELFIDTLSSAAHTLQILAWNPYCILDSSITITIQPFNQVSILNGNNVSFCPGDSLLLQSDILTENQWFFEGNNVGNMTQLWMNTPGIYFITNGTLCQTSDSIEVDFYATYQDTISQLICTGDSILIGAIYYSANGYYPDSLSSINGCDSTVIFHLVNEFIDLDVNQSGFHLSAVQSAASYQWLDCSSNTILIGEINQSFYPTQDGVYAVIVNNGLCSDTSSCYSIVGLNASENSLDDVLVIYPNPANDKLSLFSANEGRIVITSVSGELLFQSLVQAGVTLNWDSSNWANGLYLLYFQSETSTSQKIIIISH